MSPEMIRRAILVTVVVQNSAQALFMRYSFKPKQEVEGKKQPEPASATAVVMAELCKLIFSVFLQYGEDGGVRQLLTNLRQNVWERPTDLLKMAVPACLYVLQNNLSYVGVSNLDGPTFQLLYQLKMIITALLSTVMLNRVLLPRQWAALAMLAIGVGLVEMSGLSSKVDTKKGEESGVRQDPLMGFAAVVVACCASGFAGVYFEKVLKGTPVSLWVRNIQLSTFGVILGVAGVWCKDGEAVSTNGFFYGYSYAVWMAIMLNSFGGLVVAMAIKYADNVIKGFATSVSLVITALASFVFFEFSISLTFVIGAYLVVHSAFLYSQNPEESADSSSSSSSNGGGRCGSRSRGGMGGCDTSSGQSSGEREDAESQGSKGDVELVEQQSLLKSESTPRYRADCEQTTKTLANGQ